MIKFDPRKTKKLSFGYQAENIDPKNLEYYIRLTDGKIDYGIKGEQRQSQIVFEIPPLNEIIEKDINDLQTVKMEIHDKSNKYYLRPYEDSIEIESPPEINVEMNEESTEQGKSTFFITEMEDDDSTEDSVNEENEENKEDLHEEGDSVESKEDIEKKKRERKNKQLFDYLNK